MRSVPHVAALTIPSSVTATPACANAVPQTDRGNPAVRRATVDSGMRNSPERSTSSTKEPTIT